MDYFLCEIKFKDSEETFDGVIKGSLDVGNDSEDEKIFYYTNGEHEVKTLMNEDNEEDFVVLEYSVLTEEQFLNW